MSTSMRSTRKTKRTRTRKAAVPLGYVVANATNGQPDLTMNFELFFGKITTVVTSGLIAYTAALNVGLVNSFAARFGTSFDEYMILSLTVRINTCSSNLPGLLNVWIENQSGATGTPAATDAKSNKTLTFSAGSNEKTWSLSFNPRNTATQTWNLPSNTTASIGNLKIYTNNADFGSSVVATDYAVITGTMRVAFRGFA